MSIRAITIDQLRRIQLHQEDYGFSDTYASLLVHHIHGEKHVLRKADEDKRKN